MALAKMRKVTAVTHAADREKLMKLLLRLGVVELTETKELDNTLTVSALERKDALNSKLAKLNFAFGFIREQRKQAEKLAKAELFEYASPKKGFLDYAKPSVSIDDLESIIEREQELLGVISELERINSEVLDIKSDLIRIGNLIEQLKVFEEVDAPFSAFKDTKTVGYLLGSIPVEQSAEVESRLTNFDNAHCTIYAGVKNAAVAVIFPIENKTEIIEALAKTDFVKTGFNYDVTAAEKAAELASKADELENRRIELIKSTVKCDEYEPLLKILYDFYSLEYKKALADESCRFTESCFVLTAWAPVEAEAEIKKKSEEAGIVCSLHFEDPADNEVFPTLAYNNKVVAPYESITNMYSVPNGRERDPNTFVAFFYFMLFGIMLGDAAYGLILAIAGFTLYFLKKPRKGEGKLLLVIAMGGISTVIWGAMFGSWFGEELLPAIMFNPMEQPLAMLGLSLGLGVFQICFGMGIQAANYFRAKQPLNAIFGIFSWYFAFIGLGLMFGGGMLFPAAAGILKTIGMYTALAGVAMILVGGALGKKGIFGKILGGLGNVYNVTGFLSDILSYSRLFGLGLATGVVGMVINQIALVVAGLLPFGIGWVVAIPIYIVGHTFNIGINTLGTYVHNCRLQYIEFFSRFYTGSGHQFVPFGSDTKYIYLENKQ